jgi:hypothetical protein
LWFLLSRSHHSSVVKVPAVAALGHIFAPSFRRAKTIILNAPGFVKAIRAFFPATIESRFAWSGTKNRRFGTGME